MARSRKDPIKVLEKIVREDYELLRRLNRGSKKIKPS